MQLIDTHTHFYAQEFDLDRQQLIEKAIEIGVSKFFMPNIDSASMPNLWHLASQYPQCCFPMAGLHPCSVKENYEVELANVKHWLATKKMYALGEIGIDLYWDKTFLPEQKIAFNTQISLAKQYNLPIVIHSRNAFDETFEILNTHNDSNMRGIFHCFSGTIEQAEKIINLGGFKLGVGGVITFKNAGLDNVVAAIGMQHIVLETDAPYLAPAPHRGKRNDSTYLMLIAEKIAALKKITIEEVAAISTKNAEEIFLG